MKNLNQIDLKILLELYTKDFSVGELQRVVVCAYKNFSPHLNKLEELGLINVKRTKKGHRNIISKNFSSGIRLVEFLNILEDKK